MVLFLSVLLHSFTPVHYNWILQENQELHYHADWRDAYCAKCFHYYKKNFYAGTCSKELSLTTVIDYWYVATALCFSLRRDQLKQ